MLKKTTEIQTRFIKRNHQLLKAKEVLQKKDYVKQVRSRVVMHNLKESLSNTSKHFQLKIATLTHGIRTSLKNNFWTFLRKKLRTRLSLG